MPDPQGRARRRRPAPELPRRARRLARRAARLRALPLRAAPRHAAAARRSSGSRSRSPSTTAPSPGSRCTRAPPAQAGLGIDEVALARECDSARRARGRAAALPAGRCVETAAARPMHLHEEAREAGWSDEQLLEAIACVALEILHGDGQRRRRGPASTAPSRRRACCAPRSRMRLTGAEQPQAHRSDRRRGATRCCPRYHEAVELVGKRWTGAIVDVLLHGGRCASPRSRSAVPELLRPPAVRAHEGARGARHRRAPRASTARRSGSSTR